ncbi:MAG: HD domain-containing protein [Bdellovibrionota bacterium]
MEIRDSLSGSILIESDELPIIDSRFFQRLRQIKQLGFAEYSFPSATHNRYIHSLGTMAIATQAYDTIFGGQKSRITTTQQSHKTLCQQSPETFAKFRAAVRLASLLHDAGHGPLSHTTEIAMPDVEKLSIPGFNKYGRKATHEDFTLKIILDSSLSSHIEKAGNKYGFGAAHIASLIEPSITVKDGFFMGYLNGHETDFSPLLRQLISSELDADRMDYLRRDSANAGVSYGNFDVDWLVGNLTYHIDKGKCYLCLQHRALYTFEDFLISRFHMFLMVYFHYKTVVFDSMLARFFSSQDCDYRFPVDIEKYCDYHDAHLYSHISKSNNKWARRVAEKRPYKMLIEFYSGIPAGKAALQEQERQFAAVKSELEKLGVGYLVETSTGELSKYFRTPSDPIFVKYDNHYNEPCYLPLERCTDLFQKYSEKRFITRLYVSPEDYQGCRKNGQILPFNFSEDGITST